MPIVLDSRFPLLWRTPHILQLGLDNPPVVLTEVTTAHERMLSALAIGLTPEGLALIGTESGLSVEQIAEFEFAVRPALATPTLAPCARVHIDGVGPTADRLEWRLREAGLEPHRVLSDSDTPPVGGSRGPTRLGPAPQEITEIAIIIGDYVLDPERRGRWLRRDIPHLPLIYGDTSVTIGPFIEPGAGPCLYCLELHRTDADPAWPALASQLLGRVSTAQSPFIASEAATIATRMVLSRVSSGAASDGTANESEENSAEVRPATALTVDVDSGTHRTSLWHAHPECACAGLTAVADDPNLQETGTARSFRTAGHAIPTTTNEAARVPA